VKPRRDAYSTLRTIPAVFDLRDLEALLDVKREYAKILVHRWSEREMVAQLGPRAGVYFNLIVDPKGQSTRIKEAVDKLLTRPVVGIGAFALHYHNWTTQRPHLTELAVPVSAHERTIPKINRIRTLGRLRGWFHTVLPRCEKGTDGFLVAPPEIALVESIRAGGAGGLWKPDPSDIDPPVDIDAAETIMRIEEAAHLLKADIAKVRDFISQVEAFEETVPRL